MTSTLLRLTCNLKRVERLPLHGLANNILHAFSPGFTLLLSLIPRTQAQQSREGQQAPEVPLLAPCASVERPRALAAAGQAWGKYRRTLAGALFIPRGVRVDPQGAGGPGGTGGEPRRTQASIHRPQCDLALQTPGRTACAEDTAS